MVMMVVISIVLYLSDKGLHTALYKIHNYVFIETSKIIII